MEEQTSETAAATAPKVSSARAKAEARRRRILEKSKDRMSVVSGEQVKVVKPGPVVVESPEAPAEDGADVDANANDNNNNSSTAETEEVGKSEEATAAAAEPAAAAPAPEPVKMSSAARLAHMRRRRKKAAAATTAATTVDAAVEATASATSATATTETVKVDKDETMEEKPKEEQTTAATTSTSTPASTSTSTSSKTKTEEKKYLGVAKMRRKRIAEKKAAEENATVTSSSSSASASTSTTTKTNKSSSAAAAAMAKKKKYVTIGLTPILFQLVTIVFLFLAGFDVGVQNHIVVKQDVPLKHENLAFVDHGIGALKLVGMSSSPSTVPTSVPTSASVLTSVTESVTEEEEDEFAGTEQGKPSGASSSSAEHEPIIDPIFGVDFDQLTAGPGIFLLLARKAIAIHRAITYLFLTLPLAIIHGILSAPKRMFVNPPILFFCAIIIRYVGRHILGGCIPDLDELLETQSKKSKDEFGGNGSSGGGSSSNGGGVADSIASTDFVSMGTNYVKNFVKSKFPKVVLIFTILKDARSDMFVVFCGFFVGLILPVNLLVGAAGGSIVSEEL